jgi:8-oxo-dGTP pyrophosphatase MutT (NUDIX family)
LRTKGHVAVVGIAFIDPETQRRGLILVYSQEHNDKIPMLKFPGGRKRNGEAPEETAIREVREETGLVLSPDGLREAGVREMGPRDGRYDYYVYLAVADSLEGLKKEYIDADASVEGKTDRKLIIFKTYFDEIEQSAVPLLGGMEVLGIHAQFLPELERMAKTTVA